MSQKLISPPTWQEGGGEGKLGLVRVEERVGVSLLFLKKKPLVFRKEKPEEFSFFLSVLVDPLFLQDKVCLRSITIVIHCTIILT